MKQRNAVNNAGSSKNFKKEIERVKQMKSLRKVKKMRNISKEYV